MMGWNIATLIGFGLILVGLWWMYPPLALLAAGMGIVSTAEIRGALLRPNAKDMNDAA